MAPGEVTERERLEEAARTILNALPGDAEKAVKIVGSKSIMVKAARGSVSVAQGFQDLLLEIYLARDGKIAVTSFKTPRLDDAAKIAARVVDKLEKSPLYAPLPEPSGSSSQAVDEKVATMVAEGDTAGLTSLLDPDRWGDISGMAELAVTTTVLTASNGAELTLEKTSFNGYTRIFGREFRSGQWSWVSTRFDEKLAEEAIRTAKQLAEECSKLPEEVPEPGSYRLLLSPMVGGNLLEIVASSLLAGSVLLGFSMFSHNKPGDRIASDALTLSSTPLDDELPGYSMFDDEGVATRDIAAIENGVLKTFLHNTKTARLMGAETTGNAGWILPRLFNLQVDPGDISPDNVYEALGDGLYLTNNWYTRLQNYLEGRFSTVLRDAVIRVRNGKPVSCTPGYKLRLAGSLKDLIINVEAAGSKPYNIMWWEVNRPFKLPHIIVASSPGIEVRRG
ncbi:probable peptidase [Aeropyrum pernix K1]|uniref:Probable peptidase n=1 Tax=Aeropyrum pernix (strain ATCC 700893 / DSM 11879 / JCM 9820 / NBRC 100138 / K1) TaxID=272557 RepID=Q9YG10_AERPE|nr:TldD/PmbA family protein [Aeropyrum pernix]BAA79000.1 probable peptidase [Aeropyrum pernix K1]